MDYFRYREGLLHCEDIPLSELARAAGTPLYVYSHRTVVEHYRKVDEAFAPVPHRIHYSVKANPNLAILGILRDLGSGFDIVSGGELHRVLAVGGDPGAVVFAGVGKTDSEILYALHHGVFLFNVESTEELANLHRLAKATAHRPRVSLRVNPDVDPRTHRHITTGKRENKFGLDVAAARALAADWAAYGSVDLVGLHMHIGSQITSTGPHVEALDRLLPLVAPLRAAGHDMRYLNIGGGYGADYVPDQARPIAEFASALLPRLSATGCTVLLEPGRFLMGNAGVLLTRVLYVKESGDRRFVICDAGMNDLLRPALYDAYHRVALVQFPLKVDGEVPDESTWTGSEMPADVVGPICESGDVLARERRLPPVRRGDLLAVLSAGAYGASMSSNYNSHPRPAELLVQGAGWRMAARRETYDELLVREQFGS